MGVGENVFDLFDETLDDESRLENFVAVPSLEDLDLLDPRCPFGIVGDASDYLVEVFGRSIDFQRLKGTFGHDSRSILALCQQLDG
jgi:hypothetical protein